MATYAIINIQRGVAGHSFRLVVNTVDGSFDTSAGIQSQSFNYGDGKETWNALTTTADEFTIDMLASGTIDHNFKIKMTTDNAGVGQKEHTGDGMKVVQCDTQAE